MELRTLRYFLAVAREENITRAAALLHLTQPTLSRQLMQLEEELGVQLFRRSQHRIILTDAGMLLRRRAQEIVDLSEKTRQELRPEEELSGSISIGSGDLKAMGFLAEVLAAFQRRHPRIRYELYSGNADDIRERIEQGLLDLGLLLEPVDLAKYELLRLPVKERWGVLVPEDGPLAEQTAVTPEDLAGKPLILTARQPMRREVMRWFGPLAESVQVRASGNLPYNMTQLAHSGMGVFLSIELACSFDGLRFLPLSPALESGTVLAWKKTETRSAALAALVEAVRAAVAG